LRHANDTWQAWSNSQNLHKARFFSGAGFFGVPEFSSSQAFIISLPIGTVIVMNLLHPFFTLHSANNATIIAPSINNNHGHDNDQAKTSSP
jgi:hypothetical protein